MTKRPDPLPTGSYIKGVDPFQHGEGKFIVHSEEAKAKVDVLLKGSSMKLDVYDQTNKDYEES